jgi:hypothetical protein
LTKPILIPIFTTHLVILGEGKLDEKTNKIYHLDRLFSFSLLCGLFRLHINWQISGQEDHN